MPELPEVETVKRGLAPWLEGARILDVIVYARNLRYPIVAGFERELTGKRILKLDRRAKYLIFKTAHHYLLSHLGMTGSWRKLEDDGALLRHDLVLLNADKAKVVYSDPRRFGAMAIGEGDPEEHEWLKSLGPEPLGNSFHLDFLQNQTLRRKAPIKSVLLDQTVFAGVGNIYASEALWRARISPFKPANLLQTQELNHLVQAVRDVLNDAIEAGGSSIRDHRQVNGELGYFQHHFDVYDREGLDCRRSDCTGLIERRTLSQRSTYFCPKCQSS